MAAADAIDMGILVREVMREVSTCEFGAAQATDAFENGLSCQIKLAVLIDTKSVFDSVDSVQAKAPVEKSQLVNVAYPQPWAQSLHNIHLP
eukprot:1734056-Amphidinium_carterae.1